MALILKLKERAFLSSTLQAPPYPTRQIPTPPAVFIVFIRCTTALPSISISLWFLFLNKNIPPSAIFPGTPTAHGPRSQHL